MTILYERRIVNADKLTVRRALPDTLGGIIHPDDLTIDLDNTDGTFNGLDLRGEQFILNRRDLWSNEDLLEFVGTVISQTQTTNIVTLGIGMHDVDLLQALLPKRLVTAAVFSNVHPTLGLNLPIPIIFGNSVGPYPLPLVGEDLTNNHYDYLLGEGTPTVVKIYRDISSNGSTLAEVPSDEYTVNDSAYSGYRVIRFTTQQLTFNGDHYTIYAVVNGLSTERNFARAVQRILNDSTFGLGMGVNTAAFDTAAAVLDAVGSLYCDGLIQTQRPAIDILNDLLMVYGMTLQKDPVNGAWIITAEQNQTTIQAQFGHGQNQQWGNVLQDGFKGLAYTSMQEAVKTLILEYHWHPRQSQYQLTVQRSVLSAGQERRIQNPFIRNSTTADKLVDFLSKRLIYGDQTISFTAGQEARQLQPGHLIRYNAPSAGITDKVFQVKRTERKIDTVDVEGMGWDASIFTYTAGTLPDLPEDEPDINQTSIMPTPVQNLAITASGINGGMAWITLHYDLATSETNIRRGSIVTEVSFRLHTDTQWTQWSLWIEGDVTIDQLSLATSYDYRVSRINAALLVRSDTVLLNQTTPG